MPDASRKPVIYCKEINSHSRLVVEGIPGYGIPDTFQRKIIKMDKSVTEVTHKYNPLIEVVKRKFDFGGKLVVLRRDSPVFWNAHGIDSFYELLLSNRNNCVIYISPGVTSEEVESYVLPHEFSHHQFFHFENFPLLVREDVRSRPWHLNLTLLDETTAIRWLGVPLTFPPPVIVVWDLYERIADYLIDGRLIELGWGDGVVKNWLRNTVEDVWKGYESSSAKAGLTMNDAVRSAFKKYVGLLSALDAAIAMSHLARVGREAEGKSAIEATLRFGEGWTVDKLHDLKTRLPPILRDYDQIDRCVNSLWDALADLSGVVF